MALVLTPLNGLLPAHMLRVVDGGRGPRGPQRLRLDAADAYERCLRAGMPSGCLRSGYRDRAEQQAEVDRAKAGKTPSAAAPGRSYHGEGTAADVDEPARSWLHRHGAAYGWRGRLIKAEPWHFVYDPDYDQHRDTPAAPVPEEDDMPARLIRHPNGTIAVVDGPTMTVLSTVDEANALRMTGQVRDFTAESPWQNLPDGLAWTLMARIAARHAAATTTDPAAVAAALAPLLVPAVVDALATDAALTEAQVQAAAERAVRAVLGDARAETRLVLP